MKIIASSILLLTFPHFVQSLRFGLLRIVESNVGLADRQSPVADFRSLFDEDLKFNSRGLFGDSLSLSLSMSFPFSPIAPSAIFTKPTAVPTISTSPIFIKPQVLSPAANPVVNDTTANSTFPSDKNSTSSITGNATSPMNTEKSTTNVAMIAVASCALVALVVIVAKKMSKSKRASSLPKGASTTSSINESSSNDVSSVGSTSESGNYLGNVNSNGTHL